MKNYNEQLRDAFENPAKGGNERSGIEIPSSMGPLPVDKNFASGMTPDSRRVAGGLSLKDQEIERVLDAEAPESRSSDWKERIEANRKREELRQQMERLTSAPPSGAEATPMQAFWAGEEGARANQISSAVGDGRWGSRTGVPDMRNHAQTVPGVNADNIFAPRDITSRSRFLEGDSIVRPNGPRAAVVSGPRPDVTENPPTATIRGSNGLPLEPPNPDDARGRPRRGQR